MRAVVIREFGPPEVLRLADVPDPEAGEGQVVIGVKYAGITFVETQVRAGKAPRADMLPALPAILGNGVGGVVVAVGAGVDPALLDRRVVASLRGTGGYAERAVVDATRVIDVPARVPTREATALLADGRTAIGLIERSGLRAGETALVEAAAGGVGSLLVQLAQAAGAEVVALAGSEAKLDLARELGAATAIDYRSPDWAERVRGAVASVDVVFDGVGGDVGTRAYELLGAGGRFCPFGMASGGFATVSGESAAARGVTIRRPAGATPEEMAARARAALGHAASGRLRAVIGQELALDRAAEAHAAIEARATVGKTLLVASGGYGEASD